ncbi:MAG: pyrroline-5-carboxylate reductase [Planctomyces sp.]|nr:pyrroline-5-carboxylate reductase [Planctomyces sp.]
MPVGADMRIGFIGCGRMATAIARGLLGAGVATPRQLVGSDPSPDCRRRFAEETSAETFDANSDVVRRANILVLAVKPQQLEMVLQEICQSLDSQPLVVSIVAGAPIARIAARLGADKRLVRVMPNTPCLVKAGATAVARGGSATAADAETVLELFSTIGIALEVPESQLDAVTGLSGSGPAYAFQIIEALSDGGVAAGLPRHVATRLAAQTLLGAAEMVLATGEHPGALKDAVASPGGTTIAGLLELERGGLRGILMNAVVTATHRSQALGRLDSPS